jgi:hypothetical protein
MPRPSSLARRPADLCRAEIGLARPDTVGERPSPAVFSALELQVIAIGASRREQAINLTDHHRTGVGRLLAFAFGVRAAAPLADPRLEALRAMAAAVRKRPHDPAPAVVAAFLGAGWSRHCIAELGRSVAAVASQRRRR